MLTIERHSLLYLSPAGRAQARECRVLVRESDASLWERYAAIPAIYAGRRTEDGLLQVGFSYPERENGRRVRIAAAVEEEHILSTHSPWEIAAKAMGKSGTIGDQMRGIAACCAQEGLRLGLFGAAAMETETGLAYLHRKSDLDLLVDHAPYDRLWEFYTALSEWEYENGSRCDVELRLADRCYCKLCELLRPQSTLLCRGGAEPVLLSRRAALEMLGG